MFVHDNGNAQAELMLNFSVSMCIAESLHAFISGEKMKFPADMMRRVFVN